MKFPAFRLYTKEWLSSMDVRRMDAEQKGWFVQLLIESWECSPQCFLPSDDALLRTLAGATQADNMRWHQVLGKFAKKGDKIFNKRLLKEFAALKSFRKGKSQAGKNGALKRWHSHSSAKILPMANDSSASASASASAIIGTDTHTQGPKLSEVRTEADMRGIPAIAADQFWNHFEASGWIDRNGNPIRNWKAKLMTWSANRRAEPAESNHKANELPRDDFWRDSKQLDQVDAEIKAIEARASETPMGLHIEARDKANYATLKTKRGELKRKLGLRH